MKKNGIGRLVDGWKEFMASERSAMRFVGHHRDVEAFVETPSRKLLLIDAAGSRHRHSVSDLQEARDLCQHLAVPLHVCTPPLDRFGFRNGK